LVDVEDELLDESELEDSELDGELDEAGEPEVLEDPEEPRASFL
jgi:hypothetical protein